MGRCLHRSKEIKLKQRETTSSRDKHPADKGNQQVGHELAEHQPLKSIYNLLKGWGKMTKHQQWNFEDVWGTL
jgi:hypothetical protein